LIENPETLTGVVLNGANGIYDVHTDIGVYAAHYEENLKKRLPMLNRQNQ